MKKHSISHGAAVLVATVTSTILVELAHEHAPAFYKMFNSFSEFIVSKGSLPVSPNSVSIIIYAVIIASIWGAAFAFLHKD